MGISNGSSARSSNQLFLPSRMRKSICLPSGVSVNETKALKSDISFLCLFCLASNTRASLHVIDLFCACVYRSRDALFLDNRRDFTKMGQTD